MRTRVRYWLDLCFRRNHKKAQSHGWKHTPNAFPCQGRSWQTNCTTISQDFSPYKATGLDEILNMVIKKCINLIIPYLLQIYRVILKLGIYVDTWREVITCVLRSQASPDMTFPNHTGLSLY